MLVIARCGRGRCCPSAGLSGRAESSHPIPSPWFRAAGVVASAGITRSARHAAAPVRIPPSPIRVQTHRLRRDPVAAHVEDGRGVQQVSLCRRSRRADGWKGSRTMRRTWVILLWTSMPERGDGGPFSHGTRSGTGLPYPGRPGVPGPRTVVLHAWPCLPGLHARRRWRAPSGMGPSLHSIRALDDVCSVTRPR